MFDSGAPDGLETGSCALMNTFQVSAAAADKSTHP
jgi:hypothetical protein